MSNDQRSPKMAQDVKNNPIMRGVAKNAPRSDIDEWTELFVVDPWFELSVA